MSQPDMEKVLDLIERLKAELHGHHPLVQGAALADVLSLWLVGHPDSVREELLAFHINQVRALIAPNEGIVFGKCGHPQNRP